jgi:2-desacetyl-2-hydroxyethyl bacteriochlorophyllide A dehydrogenase
LSARAFKRILVRMPTSTSTQARRLIFPAKQQVLIEAFDPGRPGQGEVLVRTQLSLMSTGTENIVFNRLFDPGTHWDKWVKYPFTPGYTSVGVVEAVGENVTTLKAGDRVAFRVGHRSHAIVEAMECQPIPDAVPFDQAVWFALAKIAFLGARAADYRIGDSALIIGAGPIGQMSIRWARAAGVATILAVDTAAYRMPLAKAGGATAVINAPITEAREAILRVGGDKLPRVVVDTTGNAAVFSAALGLAADFGKVVILGDTGQPGHQVLTPDVITRGLTVVGAHDGHNTPEWNNATISRLFFSLVAEGRFSMQGLNSLVFQPEECEKAYATANRDRAVTMGIIFDWTGGAGR